TPDVGRVLKPGIYTLQTTFRPSNATDYATVQASVTLTVNGTPPPTTPTLIWEPPAPISEGIPLSSAQLNATVSADIAGTMQYSPAAVNVLSAGSHDLHVRFVPSDDATYRDATASVSLQVVGAHLTWRTPARVAVNTALSNAQLNATAAVEGTFTYTPVLGTVLTAVGTVTLSVTFAPADGGPSVSKSVSLTVVDQLPGDSVLVPHLSWLTPAPVVWPTALGAQLNPTANIEGRFDFDPEAGEIPEPGSVSLSATFVPTDPAYRDGSVRTTLTVSKATPVLAWPTPADMVAGQTLSATKLHPPATGA